MFGRLFFMLLSAESLSSVYFIENLLSKCCSVFRKRWAHLGGGGASMPRCASAHFRNMVIQPLLEENENLKRNPKQKETRNYIHKTHQKIVMCISEHHIPTCSLGCSLMYIKKCSRASKNVSVHKKRLSN